MATTTTEERTRNADPLPPVTNATALAKADDFFTPDDLSLIRRTLVHGASDDEFLSLIAVARARRLNPLLKQIHFVKRKSKNPVTNQYEERWAFQVAIDGFRAIAQRTGDYDGQDEPEFETTPAGAVIRARVRIYRKGISRPFVGVADFDEYAQYTRDGGLTQMWKEKPRLMTAKCAEAAGFRKGFPEDLSGFYIAEELGRPDLVPDEAPTLGASVARGRAPQRITVDAVDVGASDAKRAALVEKLRAITTRAQGFALMVEIGKSTDLTTEHREAVLRVYESEMARVNAARATTSASPAAGEPASDRGGEPQNGGAR